MGRGFLLKDKRQDSSAAFPSRERRDVLGVRRVRGFEGEHCALLPFRGQTGEMKGCCPDAERTSQLRPHPRMLNCAAGRGSTATPWTAPQAPGRAPFRCPRSVPRPPLYHRRSLNVTDAFLQGIVGCRPRCPPVNSGATETPNNPPPGDDDEGGGLPEHPSAGHPHLLSHPLPRIPAASGSG